MKPFLIPLAVLFFGLVTNCPTSAAEKQQRTLGVMIFPGVEMLDACGPMEMWGNLKGQIKVITVAKEKGAVKTAQGPELVAAHDFATTPPLDLLLVPGGFGVMQVLEDTATLEWLRVQSSKVEVLMSVCNGASILAAAGLLDGRKATTNKAYWTQSTAPGPKVNWIRKARWVDDGDIVTSSGVSAGMDMSLHVISRLFGERKAEMIARQTEYEWHQDPAWDPFADLPEVKAKR